MKQIFLLMTAALAASASAEVIQTQPQKAVSSDLIKTTMMKKAPAQQVTVIKTLKSGAMGKLQLVRAADGRIGKQIVNHEGKTILSLNRPSAKAPAAVGSVYEDFSGWDGTTSNWIPEDWSEINSDEPTINAFAGSYTWHAEANEIGFLASPQKGKYMCSVYMAMDQDTYAYLPQDEWLIAPQVTVAENQKLQVSLSYSPIFIFDMNYVDWDTFEFTETVRAASVQVMLREAGAEEWTLVEDYFDLWKDYSMLELFDFGMDNSWRTYTYDLSEYAGKDVEIAFRYEGLNGDNWAIDFVSIDQPRPEACYTRPQGAFYFGYGDNYTQLQGDGKGFMLMPGDTDVTWTNTSNEDATLFQWTYFDPVTDEVLTSSDVDLTLNYPMAPDSYNWYNIPELAAYAFEGANASNYAWNGYALQAGGYAHYVFDGVENRYGVGNYDPQNMFSALQFAPETPLFGISEGTNAGWSSLLGKEVELTGIGNYFEQPMVPYQLSGISVLAGGEIPADAELQLTVTRVVDGMLVNEIASATCSGADVISPFSGYYSIPFDLGDLTIEDAILVMLDVKNATGITQLTPWHTYYPDAQGETNGYFTLNVNGQEQLHALNYIENENGPCYCSFLFNLNMSYPTADVPVALEGISQQAVTAERFNVAGQRINGQQTGLIIERAADGSVHKVMK